MQFQHPSSTSICGGLPQESFLPAFCRNSSLLLVDSNHVLSCDDDTIGQKADFVLKQYVAPLPDCMEKSKCMEDTTKRIGFNPSKHSQVWDCLKSKTVVPPPPDKENNAAAITIQRIVRGGWQRLQFRVVLLQHKLDTQEEQTAADLETIRNQLEVRKAQYSSQMKASHPTDQAQDTMNDDLTQNCRQVIDYLRKDNKKLRILNETLHSDILELARQNQRLEEINRQIEADFASLQAHVKELKGTEARALEVIPEYEQAIHNLEQGCDLRHQYTLVEHTVKVSYMKCLTSLAEMVEKRCEGSALSDEIVGYCADIQVNSSDDVSQ